MSTREEQIAYIDDFCSELAISRDFPTDGNIREWLEEAERRAEERVRAECSEEISSLRNGLSKCAALTNGFASPECSISFLSESVPEELRLHINHLKAEIGRDSERLDWLCRMIRGPESRRLIGIMSDTSDLGEWRKAIDAVRQASDNGQKS